VPNAKQETQNRHCVYYAGFLHQRQTTLRGPEQARALDEIEDELDNMRESWQWAAAHSMRHEIHQSMHSLFVFCHLRGQAVEGERLFDLAITRFEPEDSATLAYLLLARPWLAWFNGRTVGVEQFPRAIQLAYTLWTEDVIAMPLRSYDYLREGLLSNNLFDDQRQEQVYRDFLERFRSSGQRWGAAFMLFCLGEILDLQCNSDEAQKYLRESKTNFIQIGDRWASLWPDLLLGGYLGKSGKYQEALQLWQEHQDIGREVGQGDAIVYALTRKTEIATKQEDYRAARQYIAQGIESHMDSSSHFVNLALLINAFINMVIGEDRHERAVELASFLWHLANDAHSPYFVHKAQYHLDSLVQQLLPDSYQQAVARGKTLHLRTILEQLLNELSDYSPPSPRNPQADALTEREMDVLRRIAEGYSNRQIARDLFLTLNTVKSHIHHLFSKLGVASRTQAVARARELHLI
jgi:ATP/maltotriose-dependent transcriptional regulator MalT